MILQLFYSFHGYFDCGPVSHQSEVRTLIQYFRYTQFKPEFPDIIRQYLFKPVTIKRLNNYCRIISLKQSIIETGCTGHIPGGTNINTSY